MVASKLNGFWKQLANVGVFLQARTHKKAFRLAARMTMRNTSKFVSTIVTQTSHTVFLSTYDCVSYLGGAGSDVGLKKSSVKTLKSSRGEKYSIVAAN